MKIELGYVQVGDYLIPNLTLEPQSDRSLGKYGLPRRSYLKEHRPGYYNHLILTGKLYAHLLGGADEQLQSQGGGNPFFRTDILLSLI